MAYLTHEQVNVLSAALSSHRRKLRHLASSELVSGNDSVVQRLLSEVETVDNLTAIIAATEPVDLRESDLTEFRPAPVELHVSAPPLGELKPQRVPRLEEAMSPHYNGAAMD